MVGVLQASGLWVLGLISFRCLGLYFWDWFWVLDNLALVFSRVGVIQYFPLPEVALLGFPGFVRLYILDFMILCY